MESVKKLMTVQNMMLFLVGFVLGFIIFFLINKYQPSLLKLNENFADDVSNPVIKMYNYNTSWCGWSKKFQPEWDTFTDNVRTDSTLNSMVEVKDIKCDDEANKQLCASAGVEGYPTVVISVNGVSSHYDGERTAVALMNKLNQLKASV